MLVSYDKLSKEKEKETVLLVAKKMDSVAPPKALTPNQQLIESIQSRVDDEINKSVECIKSCGLLQYMSFQPPPTRTFRFEQVGQEDPDYSIKMIFYGPYLRSYENFKFFDDNFVQEGIEQKHDNLIRLYESLSLENYNKLIATPGNNPLVNKAITKALVKTLIDADFPMRIPDQRTLEQQLGLWNQNSFYASARPDYSMFEMAKKFIKCKIDFIEKIIKLEKVEKIMKQEKGRIIRDGQHLIPVHPRGSEQILTTKTIYLKQFYPENFKKLGTLIDTQTDKTYGFIKTYYYFSENPKQEYTSLRSMFFSINSINMIILFIITYIIICLIIIFTN